MSKILFRNRYGSDLYKFMQLSLSSSERANEWALSNFAYVDSTDENLNIVQIANIKQKKPDLYMQLTNSIFPFDLSDCAELEIYEDEIKYDDGSERIRLRVEPISSDMIQQMQAEKENFKKGSEINLMFKMAAKMFGTSFDSVMKFPAILAMHLCNEVNTFLGQLTTTRSHFDVSDELLFPSSGNDTERLGKLVSSGEQAAQENQQAIRELEDTEAEAHDRIVALQRKSGNLKVSAMDTRNKGFA